jgi:glycopeptide antibiotics resistance protein
MGKRQVHVVAVKKSVTVVLLILVSAAIALLVWFLSGKAYVSDAHPIREMVARLLGSGRRSLSRDAFFAFLMPITANILLFMPWGFLLFLVLDRPERPRRRTYLLTLLGGVMFSALVQLWQIVLPTRVTGPADAVANAFGAFTGAILGQMRKTVQIRFDF